MCPGLLLEMLTAMEMLILWSGITPQIVFHFYENNNGVFTYRVRIGGYSGVFSPLFADFDGDDRGDLVAVGQLPPSGIPSTLMFIKGVTTGGIPVELTSFTATVTRNSVSLNWQTATELNNSRFEIERKQVGSPQSSVGNQEWNVIAFVPGFGTTTEPKSYSFADENLSAGKYQYRLKQIDFDGIFEYSKSIDVEITTPTEFSLEQNYPNPFNPTTLITFGLQEKSIVNLKVFNLIGEEVALLLNEEKAAGVHTLTFNSESLPSGVYFYKLQAGSFTQTKKMILLR
ncbi:MAG: T9SS type A sorting domain-containing protein [Ignavibacteriales bacterium]|nr:T9SS type A sorting domain-containing protein [Ignavibacteriales bacterium]